MAYPTPPSIDFSYTGFEQTLGDLSFPGTQLDNDLANLADAIESTDAFLAASFRSDGVLNIASLPANPDLDASLLQSAIDAAASAASAAASAASIDTSAFFARSANLSDVPNAATARNNLGLGALATRPFVDIADLALAIQNALLPTGIVCDFALSNAPDGWVKANGGTIGNALSNADRADADTQPLFNALWVRGLPVRDSGNTPVTRGATAAADYAANRRIVLPDARGEFSRGWDDGRGVDSSRTLMSTQAEAFLSHTHTASASAVAAPNHTHVAVRVESPTQSVNGTTSVASGGQSEYEPNAGTTGAQTSAAGGHTHAISVANNPAGGAETRPRNIAWMRAIKL